MPLVRPANSGDEPHADPFAMLLVCKFQPIEPPIFESPAAISRLRAAKRRPPIVRRCHRHQRPAAE
jgi:hypothetical protein